MARGSVIPYKDGYAIRYDGPLGEDGKRKQVFRSGFRTHQEADEALVKALYHVSTGEHLTATAKTVGDLCAYWRDVVLDVRQGTSTRYGTALKQHIIPALGKIQVQALTVDHVHRAFRTWEKDGVAASSRRHLHAILHQVFQVAIDQHLLLRNPIEGVKCPAVPQTDIQVWSEEQLDTFLQATEQTTFWGMLWHLAGMTGMRRGELLGLRWRNVDWARGHLHVRQQIVLSGRRPVFGELKTPTSRRTVAVGEATMDLLKTHRKQQSELRLKFGPAWVDNDLVFARQWVRTRFPFAPGTPWLPDSVSAMWRDMVAQVDVPAIKLHDVRHTHATILLRCDGNVKAIATRLGHDPMMLMKVYAHHMVEDQERAISRFEIALAKARRDRQDSSKTAQSN